MSTIKFWKFCKYDIRQRTNKNIIIYDVLDMFGILKNDYVGDE